ncbi:MAG TPA: sigma-70 family RNA polymerase sigma factor [Planctomycetota bacterium]
MVSGDDDDVPLLRRCLTADPGGWDHFVRRFNPSLEGVIRLTFLRTLSFIPEPDVENVLQDLYLRLYEDDFRRLRSFQSRCPLRLWLRSLAVRHTLNHLRSEALRGRWKSPSFDDLPLEAPPEDDASDRRDESARLARLLDDLPPVSRAALKMFYFDGLPYRVIAAALGVPVQTLGSIISRARDRLRELAKRSSHDVP